MGLGNKKDSSMLELENMQRELEGKFSPLSNRRKSGKNGPLPLYWYPFLTDSDAVCSLDMVRLKLRFLGDRAGVELDEMAATFPCDGYQCWTARVKPGGWRMLHTFSIGESSVALGIGLMSSNCSIDMAVGFLEFNPNKVASSDGFAALLVKLRTYVMRAELVRYDLAVDVAVSRSKMRLAKDGRKYKCEISLSMTEYLGRRNSGGYVKVYDKAAESELECDLTRIELTCDSSWSLDGVRKKWPVVYCVADALGDGLTKNAAAVVRLLALVIELGGTIEPELLQFDKKTRKKYRNALMGVRVPFPEEGATAVMLQACAWSEMLTSDGR